VIRTNATASALEIALRYRQRSLVEDIFRSAKIPARNPADLPQMRRDHPRPHYYRNRGAVGPPTVAGQPAGKPKTAKGTGPFRKLVKHGFGSCSCTGWETNRSP
jgi:hypothetical protein